MDKLEGWAYVGLRSCVGLQVQGLGFRALVLALV